MTAHNGDTVWIVGQAKQREASSQTWEFQGVFLTEQEAIDACRTDQYFIAPAIVGQQYSHESSNEWADARYPKVGQA